MHHLRVCLTNGDCLLRTMSRMRAFQSWWCFGDSLRLTIRSSCSLSGWIATKTASFPSRTWKRQLASMWAQKRQCTSAKTSIIARASPAITRAAGRTPFTTISQPTVHSIRKWWRIARSICSIRFRTRCPNKNGSSSPVKLSKHDTVSRSTSLACI